MTHRHLSSNITAGGRAGATAEGRTKRKPGPRTKCGRIFRAYKDPEIRDHGPKEFQAKRQYLVNGADPQLAATASGILLANGLLTREQYDAAMRYAWAHALVYGKPWRDLPAGRSRRQRAATADAGARARQVGVDGLEAAPRAAQGGRRCRGVRLPAHVVDGNQAEATLDARG